MSDTLREQIDLAMAAFAPRPSLSTLSDISLEELVLGPDFGSFPNKSAEPQPCQVALIRAIEGKPVEGLLTREQMVFHFGTDILPPCKPRVIVVRCGVRAGKSLICALAMLWSALTCDASAIRPGEFIRAPIVSAKLATSRTAIQHLIGTMQASPHLRSLFVGKPLTEQFRIRRPDGHEVLFELLAASPAGTNLRSSWFAGCMLDEGAFFGHEDAAINLEDQINASKTRLLPGAQLYIPSSPFAREGGFHLTFEQAFGRPGVELAFHSDTLSMNPTLVEVVEDERRKDPHNASREFDAIPLDVNSAAFFPESTIQVAVAAGRQMLQPNGDGHVAGVDLGFRKNSSALALARVEGGRVILAFYDELVPETGRPLVPSDVMRRFAATCRSYKAHSMMGDMYYADTAHDELARWRAAEKYDIAYHEVQPTAEFKADWFTRFRTLMSEGKLELPDDPRLINQLRGVKSRAAPGGVIQIQIPKQGQSHGDVLFAVVLACCQAADRLDGPRGPAAPPVTKYFSQMD